MTLLGFVLLLMALLFSLSIAGWFFLRPIFLDERAALALRLKLLLIVLPKERPKEGESREMWKERVGRMEQFYATLSGIRGGGWRDRVFGRPYFVFELAVPNVGEEIHFYLAVPRRQSATIEKHIHGFFPEAYVEEVDDYTIFHPESKVAGAAARLRRRPFLPIRTYRELESDPLAEIANALSKLEERGEGAAVQMMFRPAPNGWNALGLRVAGIMKREGADVKKALRIISKWQILRGFAELLFAKSDKRTEQKILTPLQEETVKAIEEKAHCAAFEVNLRIITAADTVERAQDLLEQIAGAFAQFDAPEKNGIQFRQVADRGRQNFIFSYAFRVFRARETCILDTAEMTSFLRFPAALWETPRMKFLKAKPAPPPADLPREGILLGVNVYRGVKTPVHMTEDDRRRHLYVIGQTGTGKSKFIENMIRQDIARGAGVGVIDPHGELAEEVLGFIPKERADDVIYFDPSDTARPIGLNMLDAETAAEQDFAVQEMIAIFYKLFPPEYIGPMFEHNMRNAMLTLMADRASPGTLVDIPRIFTDDAFVQEKLRAVTDPLVRAFWEKEMKKTTDYHKSEMLGYLVSKVGRFVENTMMRNIIGQPRSGFNFMDAMNQKKILLVNLSKGKTGEVNSNLLGLIVVSKLQMAALRRADMPEEERKDFYLYIDEFQNYTTDSIATILSEARKYKLDIIMAHQFIRQLEEKIRDAVFGNVGSLMAFRVGADDAETLKKQFEPTFSEEDLINIDNFNGYLRMLIHGRTTLPFNIQTIPPVIGDASRAKTLIELSRLRYGKERAGVEDAILLRSQLRGSAGMGGMEEIRYEKKSSVF